MPIGRHVNPCIASHGGFIKSHHQHLNIPNVNSREEKPSPDMTATSSIEKPFNPEMANASGSSKREADADATAVQEPAAEPASPRSIHGILWVLVVMSTLSSIFLYAMDNTVVADVTPTVANEFGNVVNLPWLSVGFLVGGVAVVLPFGKLYSLFDAKWLYIVSAVIFNVGSALCGAAPNIEALIVGRVLAGLGGNGMYLGVMTLLSVMTSDRERPGYLSFVGLVWGIGIILGPVVGGAFTQSKATWRWAFYINLCVAALFAPVYLFGIPSWKPRKGSRNLDLIRDSEEHFYAWNSGTTIALFVVAGVLFIAFGIQQAYAIFTTLDRRVFPSHFLRNHNAVLLYMVASAVNTAGFIPIYYIPLYFQFTQGDDPIKAGVRLLPLICVLSVFILLNGHLSKHCPLTTPWITLLTLPTTVGRFSYFQPWYIFGSVLTLIGGVLLSSIYGFEVLVGVGTGSFIQAGYAVIQAMVPPEEMAYGISFMMLAQLGGIGIGLSIAGAVFVNTSLNGLSQLLPQLSRVDLQLLIAGTSNKFFETLTPEQRSDTIDIIVSGLSRTFILVYVAGAFSLVASLLFTKRKMFAGATAIVG
ncbi:uncharacterized protein PG998_002308 [Apiospora kogelbergensis]|uniref:uncharacterized protein n=1 Tax=Apiospora kogelbergensis TaxID=1337665 RepID=UPI00312FA36E